VLAPLGLACLWFGTWAWLALVALAAGGLAVEWVHLCGRRALTPEGLAVPFAVLAAGGTAAGIAPGPALLVLAVATPLVWLLAAATSGRAAAPVRLAAGVLYIGPAAIALVWLRADPAAGLADTLFLLLIVWASDIGAYTAGRLLGGPLLAPAISPAKTWSGAAGGLLAAVLTGLLLAWIFLGAPVSGHPALVAGGLGVVAQLGDLLESAIKRRFGVKDSSRLIPGHGGLLDRLDGVLTVAPVAALLALPLDRGVIIWS